MAGHHFQFSDRMSAASGGLFGAWESDMASALFGVSEPAAITWRVQLPSSLDAAQAILAAQEVDLQHRASDLVVAQQRLASFIQQMQEPPAISFSLSEPAMPEAHLMADMQPAIPSISFSVEESFATRAEDKTRESFIKYLGQVSSTAFGSGNVETELGGRLVGRTVISSNGDMTTSWAPNVTPPLMQLHCQSIRLALASRVLGLRLLNIVGAGALKLAPLLATPGATILALPLTWNFVLAVLEELRSLRPQVESP